MTNNNNDDNEHALMHERKGSDRKVQRERKKKLRESPFKETGNLQLMKENP